ncbi:MAG: GTP-binding protein [Actinophytocola sp.]|uniref:dynamin family protein n=1 Tax=Actinophytocola sp. TaxID=1872138 RepID=UPI00132B39EE|nr:dynamin family protein [Actinophytocola sp.]MPZ82524.1 GTP-binding protein [Actinophytocola sp.]
MTLSHAVRHVLAGALATYGDQPRTVDLLRRQLVRLDEPLRVAIAGKVKAGKSTLLNALVGEAVAPTDAGECTRVVTWYRNGPNPRIVMYPKDGGPAPLPVVRRDGALEIDLGATPAERLDRLVVDWPAQSLRATTLIDTPGVASINSGVSDRTARFLEPDDDTPTEADAVLYLMRHLHVADAEFLESFRDQGVARATAVNTVAVISRADEIGAGRLDAMFSARAIATRYRTEPALRGLCQNVVAVAGLLAHTGRTLRQAEFVALTALAGEPRESLDAALLSTDRFLRGSSADPSVETRRALVRRFGLFGIRVATSLIRQGTRTPAALADELVTRSGLGELQRVLQVQFGERRDLLKARSALLALDSVVRADGDARGLGRQVERILAGAHEFAELRLLSALRSGGVTLPAPLVQEAEQLLGGTGSAPAVRLGLPEDAPHEELRRAAYAALRHWQAQAENPMFGRRAADACRTLVRTCEGVLARAEFPAAGATMGR